MLQRRRTMRRTTAKLAGLALLAIGLASTPAWSEPGSGKDAADRTDRVDRDTQRALERVDRDTSRLAERAARDEARYAEDRAEILTKTADDPVRQQEELAKLEAERIEDQAKIQEEASKIAEELAEELHEIEEDAAERAERSGEHGDSTGMSDLAERENPEFDKRGFPVRKGEVVGLNLTEDGIGILQAQGFAVIATHDLPALNSRVTRLSVPEGLEASGALDQARLALPGAVLDYTHYYAMQFQTAGGAQAGKPSELPRKKGRLTIGMIDTGVVRHSALRGVSIESRSFGDASAASPKGHGTAVASILASEGSSRIYVGDIFRGSAARPFTSADAIVDALEWMVANGVPVVNMSLAGPRNAILDRLVEQSVGRGTLIVAAAGNGGATAPPAYPAALRSVVAVTAVDQSNRVYRYANQGRYITVAAHGVDEAAADSRGGISRFSGTSFATPHISAWMARCLGKASAIACGRKLRKSARDLGEPGYDPVYGYGLVE